MATPQKLFSDITAGKFKPVYYFYGSEDFRISEAVKFLTRQFLPEAQLKVNNIKLDAKRNKPDEIILKLSNLPMLGERQVFVISDFQSLRPNQLKQVLKILEPPDPNRLILFTSPASKMPKKTSAFFKAVSGVADVVEFKKLNLQESCSVIQAKLNKANVTIMPDALKTMAELIAGNRGALESESEKLINLKESGETVTLEDVKNIAQGYEVYNLFELSDYIVASQTAKVLKMLRSLISEGNSPVLLATLLQQHFTSLYLVKNGKQPLGNRGFLTYKYRQQSDKYDSRRLEDIIIQIAQTDADLRRTGMDPQTQIEALAVELTGKN